MPRRRNSRRRPYASRRRNKSSTGTEILRVERTQIQGSLPATRDVRYDSINSKKVYTFERSWQAGLVALATSPVDTFGSIQITLNSFPGYLDFTSLFDLYRIVRVQVVFTPTSQNSFSGPLMTVIDYDDAATPTSIGALTQYQTLQITPSGSTVDRVFTPRIAVAAYSGSAFTSYASSSLQWIDSNSPAVPHYGLKYAVEGITGTTSGDAKWSINVKAVFQFRNPL